MAINILLILYDYLPLLQSAFRSALERVIEQRLAADASTLISAARVDADRLIMPQRLPDEEFNLVGSKLLGLIYDRDGREVWRSPSARDEQIAYKPRYDGTERHNVVWRLL